MDDLLGALMQGGQQTPEPEDANAGTDPLALFLQNMMSGQAPRPAGAQTAGAQEQATPAQGQMDMGGLLGSLLGGAGPAPQQTGAAQGGMDMGGLLGGLLGGMGQSQAGGGGGIGDLLGAVMGGGSAGGAGSFLTPIVAGLAEKLGLPPQIAQTVVTFVLGKLAGSRLQSTGRATPLGVTESQATSMEDVIQRMSSGKRVTKTAVKSAGLAKELAAQTGMSRAEAEASLLEVFNALGGQLGAGK